MAAKLRLILKRIPWSLVLKAGIFGVAWLLLPFWGFLLLALYFYFLPLFQPSRLFLPFGLSLLLAAIFSPSVWAAIFLAVLFFFILGIKDFILLERLTAYSLLVFVLCFLIFFYSFLNFDTGLTLHAFGWFLLVGVLFFMLGRGLLNYSSRAQEIPQGDLRFKYTALALGALVLVEGSLVLLFLPLNFFYKTALLFIAGVILLECMRDYFGAKLGREHILTYFSIFFVGLIFILSLAEFAV